MATKKLNSAADRLSVPSSSEPTIVAPERDTPGTTASVYGPDFRLDRTPSCFVMLRVVDGEFERVHPATPGTLDCEPQNLVSVALDPASLRPA